METSAKNLINAGKALKKCASLLESILIFTFLSVATLIVATIVLEIQISVVQLSVIQLLSSVIILVLVVNAIRSLKKSGEEIWQAGLKAKGTIDSDGDHANSGIAVSHKAKNQGDIELRCPKCKVFAFIQENQSSYYICYNCKSHVTAH